MIDHIYLPVSDLKRSSEFYKKLLEPLGIDMPYKFDQPPILGFAINSEPGFWLKNGEVAKDLYVAFTAKSADAVRASYKAAIDAGAPDGYNIEIAYKPWLYKEKVRAIRASLLLHPRRRCDRAAHSHSGQTPLIPETAQHNEAKEEKRGKDFRYLHGAYGRGLCDSIRRKNVAHGFDPRIECGQFK